MKMFAKSFILFFVYGFLLASTTANSAEPLKVVTTIFPLYDFAREIGQDKVDISMLLPPGVEAHTFEPKAQDIVKLNKADIFLYTNQFMEPWAADILNGVTNKTLTVVDSSQGITLMSEAQDDHGTKSFEWAGAFELDAGEYIWSFAKVKGDYADPAMKMVIVATNQANAHEIEENETAVEKSFAEDVSQVQAGGILIPQTQAYELVFDQDKDVSKFTLKVPAKAAYIVFTEHMPTEFEAKEHFLKDSKGADVEPKEQEPKQAHHHHEGGKDPHIWLDLELAQKMVDTIASAFATKDTANSAFYLANAQSYKSKLQALDSRYKETLSSCEIKTIIYAGHFAFGYFAKRYNLTHVSPYKGFSPDAEPTAKRIKAIIDTINNVGSNTIYYEELIDPKVARMISTETGAKLELLHGAHNVSKDEMSKISYLKIMDDNLPKLKDGLRCK